MTPQDRLQFEQMQKDLATLKSVQDINFIENIKRRLDYDGRFARLRLNDLADVDTDGVSNGQVIKYNSTTDVWENANDIDT